MIQPVSDLSNLFAITDSVSRSISAENFTGEKGKGGMATEGTGARAARDLGQKWKISPSVNIKAHTVFTAADLKEGEGSIRHIWATLPGNVIANRLLVMRIYWDGCELPSVECPSGDFFASAYQDFGQISSLPVCVNPRAGMNCYWTMPFKKGFRITFENLSDEDIVLYYQVDYVLSKMPDEIGYFHAQWRRSNPLPYKEDHILLDTVHGRGQYVGTYMLWGTHSNGWWGEGEIKFFMDGDEEFPTICGTGTEDYFCGSYDFNVNGEYRTFTTPYCGLPFISSTPGETSQRRFSLYRWHITDPIYFQKDLKVTIQAIGWRRDGRYHPLQDDISSVSYFYLDKPTQLPTALGSADELEML